MGRFLASGPGRRDHEPMDWVTTLDWGTLLGAAVGALGAIGGGYLAAWVNAKARREQWERERKEEARRLAARAATDAESLWERCIPEVLASGSEEATRRRVADLTEYRDEAHASLTRLRMDHPDEDVRDAALRLRGELMSCVNDCSYYALALGISDDSAPDLEEARAQRQRARAALDALVGSIVREG